MYKIIYIDSICNKIYIYKIIYIINNEISGDIISNCIPLLEYGLNCYLV